MGGHKSGRWLLVAVLAVSVSAGLGVLPQPVAGRMLARPWGGESGHAATLPTGLAPVVRRVRGQTVAPPAFGASAAVSGTTWTQQAELTSTAQSPNDFYGSAVALSGNTAAVGAQGTPYGSLYGAVYLFTRTSSGVWSQQAELLDPQYGQGHNDQFGSSVALQGNVLVVGTPNATGPISYTGAAYVYVRSGSTWTLQAMLTASDAGYNNGFGSSVALSGRTIVVGVPAKNNLEGAAYIFVYNGQSWVQQAEFVYPGHYLLADFGNQVALWGNTALIAAPGAPVAFVYARSGATWRLQAILSAPHSPFSIFGESVVLWGTTALVGDCCSNGTVAGVVFVFTRAGATWSLRATLRPPGEPNPTFGNAVALNYHTAVVGNSGAYVFVGSGATWTLQAQLTPSDRPPLDLGYAVAVRGNTALVGATNVNGSAYVFVRSGTDWIAAGALGQGRAAPSSRAPGGSTTSPAAP